MKLETENILHKLFVDVVVMYTNWVIFFSSSRVADEMWFNTCHLINLTATILTSRTWIFSETEIFFKLEWNVNCRCEAGTNQHVATSFIHNSFDDLERES